MSLWDSVKPAKKLPTVTAVDVSPDRARVALTWTDGAHTELAARTLRQQCPCAGCVDEHSGQRTLDVDAVPMDMTVTDVATVGNYALCFTFADGHKTGIYHWDTLRGLAHGH